MGTHTQHRNSGLFLPLIGMIFAAAVVVAAGWLILSLLLSFAQYVPSQVLP